MKNKKRILIFALGVIILAGISLILKNNIIVSKNESNSLKISIQDTQILNNVIKEEYLCVKDVSIDYSIENYTYTIIYDIEPNCELNHKDYINMFYNGAKTLGYINDPDSFANNNKDYLGRIYDIYNFDLYAYKDDKLVDQAKIYKGTQYIWE